MSTSVVLLAYQEGENLKILLPKIKEVLQGMNKEYEILVVDSATPTDNTESVCQEYGARYIPQEEPFYAGAFRTGIRYAEKEYIQVLDADGSHNPEDMPAIRKKMDEGNDMVIGSRYTKGGKTMDSPSSVAMSKLLNFVMRLSVGVRARDISTSYRLYRSEQLKKVLLRRNNYDVLQEVILRLKMNKPDLKIAEVPIEFNKRMYGESKRQLLTFIRGYIVTVFNILAIRTGLKRD